MTATRCERCPETNRALLAWSQMCGAWLCWDCRVEAWNVYLRGEAS